MKQCTIEFYLYCNWNTFPQSYRVYFNDELMTERSYLWHNDTHVLRERIPVNIDPSIQHNLTLEHIGQRTGKFSIADVTTNPPGLSINITLA
jgi:hypothetical protein